jgi:hypothetical protein
VDFDDEDDDDDDFDLEAAFKKSQTKLHMKMYYLLLSLLRMMK